MNILVTGSRGQLGSELQELSPLYGSHSFFFYDLPELDVTNRDALDFLCRKRCIEVIVNCAAYTAVDKAETDFWNAFRVNSDAPALLAEYAEEQHILLIHLSTDYVFNGESCRPYRESDPADPLGIYGKSKRDGEERIRLIAPSYIIIRTSWLYSAYGSNFVKTMLRLGAERESLNVVCDQIGTPTHAADLAAAILSIIGQCDRDCSYGATYHYSNEGVSSWYDFAVAIMELAGLPCRVLPIESSAYPQIASRPPYSVLNKSAIKRDWGVEIPHWRASLVAMLAKLNLSTNG